MLKTIGCLINDGLIIIPKSLYKLLRPSSKIIRSTPNKKSFWPIIEFLIDALNLTPKTKDEQHVNLYTRKSLKNILKERGFKINKIETSNFLARWINLLGLKTAEKIHA